MKSIRIGPLTYRVVHVLKLQREEDGGDLFGAIDHVTCEIRLLESMEPQRIPLTILHEALHAIIEQAACPEVDGLETVVTALAYGIADLLAVNPTLGRLLCGQQEPRKLGI